MKKKTDDFWENCKRTVREREAKRKFSSLITDPTSKDFSGRIRFIGADGKQKEIEIIRGLAVSPNGETPS